MTAIVMLLLVPNVPVESVFMSRIKIAKRKKGLYANIAAKRRRIAGGSGEKMRKVGSKGAPTSTAFKKSAKTAKKRNA
tara:strand:- start:196 stop:429 length:234 start_codon:yes stop_codon:yes gene_type:complete